MISQPALLVQFDAFVAAASMSSRFKRAPRGVKADVPTDILLSADAEGILVETPLASSSVHASSSWSLSLSVDAKRLMKICDTLKKLGAGGHEVELSVNGRELIFKFRTTTLSVPTLYVKSD